MVARRAHNPEVVRFKSHLRNQKEKHPLRVLFFLVLKCDLNPAHIRVAGGSGPRARPPPGAGGGSATREKIRRAGGGETPRPARLYFRQGNEKSHLRNQRNGRHLSVPPVSFSVGWIRAHDRGVMSPKGNAPRVAFLLPAKGSELLSRSLCVIRCLSGNCFGR